VGRTVNTICVRVYVFVYATTNPDMATELGKEVAMATYCDPTDFGVEEVKRSDSTG